MRIDLCLQSHASGFHFLLLSLIQLLHGILQIVAHQLKGLVELFQFINGNRICSYLFLSKCIKLHALNNMLQMLYRFYDWTGKPVGNKDGDCQKQRNNCRKNTKQIVNRSQNYRFRLNCKIGIAGIRGYGLCCILCFSCKRTDKSEGWIISLGKFIVGLKCCFVFLGNIVGIDQITIAVKT